MKPEELQIGDIVMCEVYFFDDDTDKEWYEKHPIRINGVSENSDLWLDGRECMYIGEYLDDCDNEDMGDFEPMPITGEILKLNGFVLFTESPIANVYDYFTEDRSCSFFIEFSFYPKKVGEVKSLLVIETYSKSSKVGTNRLHLVNINNVHELQHALRLIGLDKLANNFKIK